MVQHVLYGALVFLNGYISTATRMSRIPLFSNGITCTSKSPISVRLPLKHSTNPGSGPLIVTPELPISSKVKPDVVGAFAFMPPRIRALMIKDASILPSISEGLLQATITVRPAYRLQAAPIFDCCSAFKSRGIITDCNRAVVFSASLARTSASAACLFSSPSISCVADLISTWLLEARDWYHSSPATPTVTRIPPVISKIFFHGNGGLFLISFMTSLNGCQYSTMSPTTTSNVEMAIQYSKESSEVSSALTLLSRADRSIEHYETIRSRCMAFLCAVLVLISAVRFTLILMALWKR